MKLYKKPEIISEQVLEKVALSCEDYIYYSWANEGCKDDYLGMGKAIYDLCYDVYS